MDRELRQGQVPILYRMRPALRGIQHTSIQQFEQTMRMFRKGQFSIWTQGEGVVAEIRLINRVFDIYALA